MKLLTNGNKTTLLTPKMDDLEDWSIDWHEKYKNLAEKLTKYLKYPSMDGVPSRQKMRQELKTIIGMNE